MNDIAPYQTITVRGLTTNYLCAGSGPVLILVHGWAQSARTWSAVLPRLAREYTVYTIDLPGFGKSEMPPFAWSIETYTQFVHEFCEALSIVPHAVIGHSFGARIALSFAVQFGVPKLVLASMSEWEKSSWFRVLNTIVVRLVGALAPGIVFYMHKTLFTPHEFADTARVRRALGKRMLEVYLRTHGDADEAIYAHVTTPTLLVYGKNDPIASVAVGSRIQSYISSSKLVVVPEAAHLVHIEQPSAFLEPILAFLRS